MNIVRKVVRRCKDLEVGDSVWLGVIRSFSQEDHGVELRGKFTVSTIIKCSGYYCSQVCNSDYRAIYIDKDGVDIPTCMHVLYNEAMEPLLNGYGKPIDRGIPIYPPLRRSKR